MFDWKKQDYTPIFLERAKRLDHIRKNPDLLPGIKEFYKTNPVAFITDWGMTVDPRNAEVGKETTMPFVLFDKQAEFINWLYARWQGREDGLAEKSRDMGVSWLCIAFGVWMWLFHKDAVIGYGSRKEEYVDKLGDPKSLFWKARTFISLLPAEFKPDGYDEKKHAPSMRIINPENNSAMVGEAGVNIGRGNRASIYFKDESAFYEQPELIDASLSQTSNCKIDVSTPNGNGNPFFRKRFSGKIPVFSFHWAQPFDAKVLTPNGWVLMGDIKLGDFVIGSDGKPKEVLGVYPQGEKEVYQVRFSDGSSTECCGDHLWAVITYGNQRAERKHIHHVMSLREMAADYVSIDSRGYRRHKYQIPITSTVEFKPSKLPISAYVLGCLLGDGSFPKRTNRPIGFSTADKEIVPIINDHLPKGCYLAYDGGISYRVSADKTHYGRALGRGLHNPVLRVARDLGLSGVESHNKFIPEIYKLSSPEDRLDILQGLLDTDGSVAKSNPGIARYHSVSKTMIDDVVFIAQTLGGVAKVYEIPAATRKFPGGRECLCRVGYVAEIRLPDSLIPFKMPRKIAEYKKSTRYKVRRSLVGVVKVGKKECRCIKVDAADGLYLTDNCIVTHNTDDPRKDENWYREQCEKINNPVIVAQELDIDYAASVSNAWISADIVAGAQKLGPADVQAIGGWIVGVDAAHEGDDKSVITFRRGRLTLPQITEGKLDGIDLALLVENYCDDIINQHGGEIAGIVIELDGPGVSAYDQLKRGRYGEYVYGIHTGKKLADHRHYNLRAKLWSAGKEYLQDAPVSMPMCPELKSQIASMKYSYKDGMLLMQDKRIYKKEYGRSPDNADSWMLTHYEVRGRVGQFGAPRRRGKVMANVGYANRKRRRT